MQVVEVIDVLTMFYSTSGHLAIHVRPLLFSMHSLMHVGYFVWKGEVIINFIIIFINIKYHEYKS